MTIEITKGTALLFAVFIVIGYFIGVVFPVSNITGSAKGPDVALQQQQLQPQTQQQAVAVNVSIPPFVPARGSDSATVNVVEFGDYQCPFCEKFFQQSEPQLKSNYLDTGKIKFYFMDFQFLGPDSITLGEGAWCANEQSKYYDYHDYIYSHQGQESSGWATPDKVKALAANISGLDTAKFNSCLDSKKFESRVQQLTQYGQSLGVSGTPTVFIGNDRKGYLSAVGAQPYDVFKQIIDKQLS